MKRIRKTKEKRINHGQNIELKNMKMAEDDPMWKSMRYTLESLTMVLGTDSLPGMTYHTSLQYSGNHKQS